MSKKKQAKYDLGIALSGGGARGFAHLGALKALEERELYPDILSGTSVGSLVAVLYADGYSADEILEIAKSISITSIVDGTIPRGGFFKSTGIQTLLKKHLRAKTFEELKIPVRVVASDIANGQAKVFCEGEIIPAVMASCSVPIVFIPVKIGENHYVDGGLLMNFPVSIIRQECRRVMGINISPVITQKYDDSLKYIIEQAMNYMVGANTTTERQLCDYLIESDEVAEHSLFDIKRGMDIYRKGYEEAERYLNEQNEKIRKDFFNPGSKPLRHKLADFILSFKSKK